MKKILGLDLGTNSIGWAIVEQDFENKKGSIIDLGVRIIPMDGAQMGDFEKGNSISKTADRTKYRITRRLRERFLLRRERLHRVLNVLGFLPEHYADSIDFKKNFGKFLEETEPKIAWRKNNKNQFEFLFKETFYEMCKDFNGAKVPYDWTLYFLRKKALSYKIKKEELAWILLNFNQKRGYYQLREDEDDSTDKREYVEVLKVVAIEKGEADKKNPNKTWYNCKLSNGWVYSATFTSEPLWIDSEKEFLVIEELDENGNVKVVKDKKGDTEGKPKRKISPLPSFEEINLMNKADQDKIYKKIKAKTELTISNSNKTVGSFIYDSLLKNNDQKINGKLIRTIERKFYKDELRQILTTQIKLQPELFTDELFNSCVRELYKSNLNHQEDLQKKDFVHLFIEDIIFYQRPLKSQKSSISNCPLEFKIYRVSKKDENGNVIKNEFEQEANGKYVLVKEHLKAAPKSNPYFQEFRLWQWIKNLSIYRNEDDLNVTSHFIENIADVENLYRFLDNLKEIDQKTLIDYLLKQKQGLKKVPKSEIEKYRWNFVEDKKYPCNETKFLILSKLKKVENFSEQAISFQFLYSLWHIIYSVTDKKEYEKALNSFAHKNNLADTSFVEVFKKIPPFKSEYGSYSEKAIKKLLPLMRTGSDWSFNNIDKNTQERIEKLITGEFDESIKIRVREKSIKLTDYHHFQGLPEWLAKYIVYDRHSEANDLNKWNTPQDLEKFLLDFKQHSLRNPIVEQIVTETLRVVKDIWIHHGKGASDYFQEIHIELGREMKNNAKERERITEQNTINENTNSRIKALLIEMLNNSDIENVRPHSPTQQEILKIYEDGAINANHDIPDDILKISKLAEPTASELTRYRLWLEQKYRSPYTGQVIPLNKLFTSSYEIEHIIPQSRYFDDSLSNKVICESEVNKLKDRQLGLEFIKNHHGQRVQIDNGNKVVEILSEEAYLSFVKENYAKNKSKRNKLLLEEIPDQMIERQLNDTRYISKYISGLLSNIVRSDKNDEGLNSKNLITCNGKITSILKQDWGLNNVWNELLLPRFERMNQLLNTNTFTSKNKEGHVIPHIPFEYSKGFQKKRLDHRHHAMDALVIACATKDHINLLNNLEAKSDNARYDLQNKLRLKSKWTDIHGKERTQFTEFVKPWSNFTNDAKDNLERIIVSFKQNLRVINKATNYYEKFEHNKKVKVKQLGTNWSIRKPLHKETVFGKVNLNRIKVPKGKILTATRKSLGPTFDLKTIESITDTGIVKILTNYLTQDKFKIVNSKGVVSYNSEMAFSPEGIDELNKNIALYNEGKPHKPIYKVRLFELGSRFQLGQTGNKKTKYVEAAKGTNLFFAIYQDKSGKRSYETIPLNLVIERLKQGLSVVPEVNDKGDHLLFHLSPNDLVYLPSNDEIIDHANNKSDGNFEHNQNIYKVVSFTGTQCFFVKHNISHSIINKLEFSPLNKMEKSLDDRMIKQDCMLLNISRLGHLSA